MYLLQSLHAFPKTINHNYNHNHVHPLNTRGNPGHVGPLPMAQGALHFVFLSFFFPFFSLVRSHAAQKTSAAPFGQSGGR